MTGFTSRFIGALVGGFALAGSASVVQAENLPWGSSVPPRTVTPYDNSSGSYDRGRDDYRPAPAPRDSYNRGSRDPYPPARPFNSPPPRDYSTNRAPDYRSQPYDAPPRYGYEKGDSTKDGSFGGGYKAPYQPPARPYAKEPYGAPYGQGRYAQRQPSYGENNNRGGYRVPPPYRDRPESEGYGPDEIRSAGHRFFGKISQGLASVIEYAFQRGGRPNGYILGQEGGGAFVAGLRYGEGTLYTKYSGTHPVYWQGPSIGYDFGAEGSKTMTLVYNLRRPSDIYQRFGGVDGSAFVVGGVGITYQQNGNIALAPIRSGVGLRLGANIGYLKYSRRPTWNPF